MNNKFKIETWLSYYHLSRGVGKSGHKLLAALCSLWAAAMDLSHKMGPYQL